MTRPVDSPNRQDDPSSRGKRTLASRRACDPELQRIVESVSSDLGYPMALVSLARPRMHLCAAHVGWPCEPPGARALDRAAASCGGRVIATGRPLELPNVVGDAQLPKELIRACRIRSYVGLPLVVCGHVLGSLCAIDTRPRALTQEEHGRLKELANCAAARLAEIAPHGLRAEHMIAHAVHPAFLEIRNLLNVLLGDISLLGLALADVTTVLDLVEHADQVGSADARDRAFSVLREALLTNQDLRVTYERLETMGGRLTRYLFVLESSLTQIGDTVELAGAIDLADQLALHVTRAVGGVRWRLEAPATTVVDTKVAMVTGLAAALRLIAEGLGAGASRGIDGSVALSPRSATVTLSAPEGAAEIYRATGAALHAYAKVASALSVAATGSHVAMRWRRPAT